MQVLGATDIEITAKYCLLQSVVKPFLLKSQLPTFLQKRTSKQSGILASVFHQFGAFNKQTKISNIVLLKLNRQTYSFGRH